VVVRQAPRLDRLDELLRLRKRAKVHPKWCTIECQGIRYLADTSLRGRKVHVLYDALDTSYVLVEHDNRIVQRAEPQRPGHVPQQPEPADLPAERTDYLQLLRDDYERRVQTELSALDLRAAPTKKELIFADLSALMQTCRGCSLSDFEISQTQAAFRKLRPIEPQVARDALTTAQRQLGTGLHVSVYLDALQSTLVRHRTKKGTKS